MVGGFLGEAFEDFLKKICIRLMGDGNIGPDARVIGCQPGTVVAVYDSLL